MWFWMLMIVAVALRIAALQGYADSDPRSYSILANDLARGIFHAPDYVGAPVFPLRIAVYLPPALLIRAFGLSEVTLVAYPFAISIASCLLAYRFAQTLFDSAAALTSLAIAALVPLDIRIASELYPDAIAAFWANLALFCLWRATSATTAARMVVSGAAAGLPFGASWLCKEAVVYLAPFVLLLAWYGNRRLRVTRRIWLLAVIGIASGAVLAAEMLMYWHKTGDALFRLHATERNYVVTAAWFFDSASPYFGWGEGGYWGALAHRLLLSSPKHILFSPGFAALPFFALIGVVWQAARRDARDWLVAAWLLVLLFMFNFMSSSFDSYKPLAILDRYVYPLLLPATMITGAFLSQYLRAGANITAVRTQRLVPAAILAGLALFMMVGAATLLHRSAAVERQAAAVLDHAMLVYSDFRTAANLAFFRDGTLTDAGSRTKPWEGIAAAEIPAGAYVLVHPDTIGFLRWS